MYFRAGEDGEHSLNAEYMQSEETTVFLEDLFTEEMIDLDENPVYTFTGKISDDDYRFRLHINANVTGIGNPTNTKEEAVNIYAYDKAVYISSKDNNNYELATVNIYDLYGRELYNAKMQLNNLTRIPVNVNNNYLVVRVTQGSHISTQKVFVK